jgi:predicted patatin/cPLA2 family phospholipase
MKALVVGGGASKGAFAGGILEYLNKDYDLLIGTSTGSLIVPFVASKKIDTLKEAYTNITQKDIFKVNPFKVDKDKKFKINYINIIYNLLIKGKKSFGDAQNLRKKIDEFLTQEIFEEIIKSHKDVLVCVTNFTLGTSEYKSIKDCTLEDFKDWIFASSSVYPFMDIIKKDGYEYIDGGFLNPCPIQEAINRGAKEIDVINLNTEVNSMRYKETKNPVDGIFKVINIMLSEINRDDLQIPLLNAKYNKEIKLNIYYTPRILIENSLIFDKELMNAWWKEGYQYAENKNIISYLIKDSNFDNIRLEK